MVDTLPRSVYLEASIAAAKTWLSVEYASYSGKPLPVHIVKSADDFRQIGRNLKSDGNQSENLETPFSVLSIGSIGLDTERAGVKKNLVNKGVSVGVDRVAGVSLHEDFRPAILGMGLAVITDNLSDVLLFAQTLLNAAPTVTISLADENGFVIACQLLIENELTVAPADSEMGNTYRFETALRLRTYIGHSHEIKIIRRIKIGVGQTNNGTDSAKTIYDGPLDRILDETFSYNDLFDKNSGVYKYDYREVGDNQ